MEEVNALKLRNNLGTILDRLTETGEPILIHKGRRLRAVMITPEQFKRRFMDVQADAARQEFLKRIRSLRGEKREARDSLAILRSLRGYPA